MPSSSVPRPSQHKQTVDIRQWSIDIIAMTRANFAQCLADIPVTQREIEGTITQWSAKDELTHLAYWIDVFVQNIQAAHTGKPILDTRDYQALNEAAWHARHTWTWHAIEADIQRVLTALEQELARLPTHAFSDATAFTVEPYRKSPRSLIRSLLYELIDHPFHHFTGLYARLEMQPQLQSLLTTTLTVLSQPGTSKWSAPSRTKIKQYALRFPPTE
jgi:hypothetical protein